MFSQERYTSRHNFGAVLLSYTGQVLAQGDTEETGARGGNAAGVAVSPDLNSVIHT